MTMEQHNTQPLLLVVEQWAFPLGFVAVTRGAMEKLRPSEIESALNRHARGDWGELCEQDRQTNERSLKTNGGVMSVHLAGENRERFYVITDPGHTVTTVLLPEEY
jgi:hypothetical protein